VDYGKRDKRISFMDTDKRAAELLIRLKHDGLTKTKFFRAILTAYLNSDADLICFFERVCKENTSQSSSRSSIIKKYTEKGNESRKKFGLDDGDIENIFDLLEKEHPDL
jgi:hypothetical protein